MATAVVSESVVLLSSSPAFPGRNLLERGARFSGVGDPLVGGEWGRAMIRG